MRGRQPRSADRRAQGERLGKAIAAIRRDQRLTQQQLATRCGIAISTLRAIEAGRTSDPGVFTVFEVARALDVSVEDLLAGADGTDAAGSEGAAAPG